MKFITTDGKLEIKDNQIIQKRLTNDRQQRIIVSIYFFVFFIDLLMKKIDKLNIEGKQSAWIGIILYSTVILVYVFIVGHILLRQILFNKIDISKISEIKIEDTENGLEKNLLIRTGSRRYKLYKFRQLENEYNRLIQHLTNLNPAIKVISE
jgi:hypothetical protein